VCMAFGVWCCVVYLHIGAHVQICACKHACINETCGIKRYIICRRWHADGDIGVNIGELEHRSKVHTSLCNGAYLKDNISLKGLTLARTNERKRPHTICKDSTAQ
jgi:hypothetical protein